MTEDDRQRAIDLCEDMKDSLARMADDWVRMKSAQREYEASLRLLISEAAGLSLAIEEEKPTLKLIRGKE